MVLVVFHFSERILIAVNALILKTKMLSVLFIVHAVSCKSMSLRES